jgi:uncharacterized protein YaeQ
MARTGTVHHLKIDLSDVDRGVYQALDLRLAQHPSETARRVLMRAVAYALCLDDGIAFSKGGLSDHEEPAIAVRDAIGIATWIEVDVPSPERLKKACTAARRVVVLAAGDEARIAERAREVPRGERVEIMAVSAAFLDDLAERVAGAGGRFSLTRSGGHLYATCEGATLDAPITVSKPVVDE